MIEYHLTHAEFRIVIPAADAHQVSPQRVAHMLDLWLTQTHKGTMTKLSSKMIVLAIDMEDTAADMRATDTPEAIKHADELNQAARMVREWAQECEK
jgi:hypothetical protein